jgi:hypothetical protein
MDVEAAPLRGSEESGREDTAVGHHDGGVGPVRLKQRERFFGLDFRRLVEHEPTRERELFDGRSRQPVAAPRGAVGLRPDGDDFVAIIQATCESRHGRLRRAHENQTHSRNRNPAKESARGEPFSSRSGSYKTCRPRASARAACDKS